MPSQISWINYGGRGIKVADEWHDFVTFLRDMGEQPEGLTLERRDVRKAYSKANCLWETMTRQARNKTSTYWISYRGERLCLSDWADRLGIKQRTLRARLEDHGWSVERALTTPVMSNVESGRIAAEARHHPKGEK